MMSLSSSFDSIALEEEHDSGRESGASSGRSSPSSISPIPSSIIRRYSAMDDEDTRSLSALGKREERHSFCFGPELWAALKGGRFDRAERMLDEASQRRFSSVSSCGDMLSRGRSSAQVGKISAGDRRVGDVNENIVERKLRSGRTSWTSVSSSEFDVNTRNRSGITPLHLCAFAGDVRCVRLLLVLGANPNIADLDGWTPLHAAAVGGHVTVIKQLVTSGAMVECKDSSGRRPRHVARNDRTKAQLRLLGRITRKSMKSTFV